MNFLFSFYKRQNRYRRLQYSEGDEVIHIRQVTLNKLLFCVSNKHKQCLLIIKNVILFREIRQLNGESLGIHVLNNYENRLRLQQ